MPELRRKAHAVMGLGVALAVVLPGPDKALPVAMLAVLGSMLPDLDVGFKHRKLLHNFFASILVIPASYLLMARLGAEYGVSVDPVYSIALGLGWVTHVLGDMLTAGGVWLFWPVSGKAYRFTGMRYDDPRVSFIGYSIGLAAALYWYYTVFIAQM